MLFTYFRDGRAVPALILALGAMTVLGAPLAAQTPAPRQTPPPAQKPAPAQTPAPAPAAPGQAAAPKAAELPAARSIVDRHIKAVGGREAILSHTSQHATGTFTVPAQGLTGSVEIFGAANPNRAALKVNVPGL